MFKGIPDTVSAKLKIGEQKIGLNHSFDFLSHYLYLLEALERVLSLRRKSRMKFVFLSSCKKLGSVRDGIYGHKTGTRTSQVEYCEFLK